MEHIRQEVVNLQPEAVEGFKALTSQEKQKLIADLRQLVKDESSYEQLKAFVKNNLQGLATHSDYFSREILSYLCHASIPKEMQEAIIILAMSKFGCTDCNNVTSEQVKEVVKDLLCNAERSKYETTNEWTDNYKNQIIATIEERFSGTTPIIDHYSAGKDHINKDPLPTSNRVELIRKLSEHQTRISNFFEQSRQLGVRVDDLGGQLDLLNDNSLNVTQRMLFLYQVHHESLVRIAGDLARMKCATSDVARTAQLSTACDLGHDVIKLDRQFKRNVENILPAYLLKNEEYPLVEATRNTEDYDAILFLSRGLDYDDARALADQNAYLQNKGIDIIERLSLERIDPRHRCWGNWINPEGSQRATNLQNVYNAWRKGTYNEEELNVAIEMSIDGLKSLANQKDSSNQYFTQQQSMEFIATAVDGQLRDYKGNVIPDSLTHGEPYIYVMDLQGNLFLALENQYVVEDDGTEKRVGHPAFVNGQAVACAGFAKIKDGKIIALDSMSGHYQPKEHSLFRVAEELKRRDVLAGTCKISTFDKNLKFNMENPAKSTIRGSQIGLPNEDAIALDLSQKHNPINFLNALSDINLYLKARASETGIFHSGRDYEDRVIHFRTLLNKIAHGDALQEVVNHISEGITLFNDKSRYTTQLQNLLATLRDKDGMLNNPFVQERVNAYRSIYEAMVNYSNAVNDLYNNSSYFGQTEEALEASKDMAELDIKYQAARQKYRDIKDEFARGSELRKTAYSTAAHR